MGVNKWYKQKFYSLSNDKYLRLDKDYYDFFNTIEKNVSTLKDFILGDIYTGNPIEKSDYQEYGIESDSIHVVVRNIKNGKLVLDDPIYIIEKKAVELQNYKLTKGDIVLAISSNCGASFYYDGNDRHQLTISHYLTRFKVDEKKLNPYLLVYYLNSKKIQSYFRATETGKTLKNLSKTYIKMLPILLPKSLTRQQKILETIAPLESEIASLKATKIADTDIINQVLGKELGLDWERLKKIDQTKKIITDFSNLVTRNDTLRFSYRWNRAVEIQKELQNQFSQCEILGNHILQTQNGCSPACGEEGDFQVLGIDSISKSTVLSFENPKFTNDKISNFDKYVIHNNDFFVSRGNTIELVSLASIAELSEDSKETIFPDLMIRITFDDKINIHYLAYIFNSLVGRLYFRNVTKGKNQTMVKVSEHELQNFIVPLPSKEKQSQIASLIKKQLDAQKAIDEQIQLKQQQILQIVENAVK